VIAEKSTTPDLVELGSRFLEAANRRDFDAIMSFFAPDAVMEAAVPGILPAFQGVAAIRGFWQDWFASYEELCPNRRRLWTSATESHFPRSSRKPGLLAAVVSFASASVLSSSGWMTWSCG
jgi:hypothetical protein